MTSLDTNDIYYNIYADIYEDDDFTLDIGDSVVLKGFSTEEAAAEAMIKTLQEAKVTWAKTWATYTKDAVGNVTKSSSGDYSNAWTWVRDAAIDSLQHGEYSFEYGGNQRIKVWIHSKSHSTNQAYKDAYLRVSPEDRKILGLQQPDLLED